MPPKASTRRTAAGASTSGEAESSQNPPDSRQTPAQSATPGPSGRPVQRLQSLKKRPASGSIPPAGRPTPGPGGEAPKPALKFKPKAVVRKSKEERDAIEKLEAERNEERLKEAAAIQRGRGGARGGRGAARGRGGASGVAGSGPLGSGAGFSFGGAKRGRGGGLGGPGGKRGVPRGGFGGGGFNDSDDELGVSIDNIHLDSDEEDEDVVDIKGKGASRRKPQTSNGLRPQRVPRREHEDRTVSVNMESSSSKAAEIREKAHAEASAIEIEDKSSSDETATAEPRVKDEPRDDDTAMEDLPQDDDFLPATPVRVRRKISDPKQIKGKEPAEEPVAPAPKRDPRALLRTPEEIEEYDRHMEDLDHFRDLLSIRVTEKAPKPAEESAPETTEAPTETEPTAAESQPEPMQTEADGEEPPAETEKPESQINEHLLGQLFLMQFPPMTPTLTIPGEEPAPIEPQPTESTEDGVKPEDPDLQITDGLPVQKETPKVITASTKWSLPAGRVGKLNVHKSGRVTMDWGGVSFELDRAATVDFAQEALIMSTPEVEPGQPARDNARQTAWSMGQLSGKFTVMPDWDQIL